MRRAFNANPPAGIDRCKADIVLRDQSAAQCMRRAVRDGLCAQHAKLAASKASKPLPSSSPRR